MNDTVHEGTVPTILAWFSYDPITGVVSWKQKPNRNIRIGDRAGFVWNQGPGATSDYVRIGFLGASIFAHTVAFVCTHGRFPVDRVDHEDGNGLNNRLYNLREATHTQNLRNQRLNASNTSGLMGVDLHSATGKWRARIIVDKHEQHLGTYDDFFEAACARKSAERRFGFHANHGRTA